MDKMGIVESSGIEPISFEEIRKANFDLGERIEAEGVTFDYNPEADVVSIIIGKPADAVTEPLIDDIMYRLDPETLKVVGVEIVTFFSDFLRKNKVARKLMRGYVELMLESKKPVPVTNPDDRALIREMIAAGL